MTQGASQDDYFTRFGLPRRYALEMAQLNATYERLSYETHPDFFLQAGPDALEQAQRTAAQLHEGYRILSDEESRTNYLLTLLGQGKILDERALPAGFLQEMFLLQEDVDTFGEEDSPERQALRTQIEQRAGALSADRIRLFAQLETAAEPHPEAQTKASVQQATLQGVQTNLNCMRYLRRLLERLKPSRIA